MRNLVILVLVFIVHPIVAQDTLRLQEAVELTLAHNFSIKVAKKRAQIAQNNTAIGEAGMLPEVLLRADQTWSVQDFNQRFISGDEVIRSGANSNNTVAYAQLNWTLFDGMRMFATLDRLEVLNELGELTVQANIVAQVAAMHRAYFGLVQLQKQVDVYSQALALSNERVRIAEDRYNLGSGSRLEWLQAQVDYNADRYALLSGKEELQNAQIAINEIIGFGPEKQWIATDSITIEPNLAYDRLRNRMLNENIALLEAGLQEELAALRTQEAKGLRYPEVGFTTNYRYNRSVAEAGFLLSSQTNGLTYGFGASMPLFTGGQVARQIANAQLEATAVSLEAEQVQMQLENELLSIFVAYENNRDLVALEQDNLAVAAENLDIAMDSYALGNISALALRDIQNSYIQAKNRLFIAQFRWKVAEVDLKTMARSLTW